MATSPRNRVALQKATIEDVARRAGVGTTTVSRVMNGSELVSPATRKRVLDAVTALGYTPNLNARRMRTGQTRTVSVMLPTPGTDFYTSLLGGIDAGLDAANYDVALFPLLSTERLKRYLNETALPYQSDALLFASLDPTRLYPDGALPTNLPVVLVDVANPLYPSFTVDNRLGGRLAAEHLLERPAPTYVIQVEERLDTPFASGVFAQRLEGFQEAMRDAGHPLSDEHVIVVEFSWGGGRVAMRDILATAKPPMNVFASCDLMAIGAIDEALHAGLDVGRDVRIVGFDDIPWAEERGLTTIRQPVADMGRAAAEDLVERVKSRSRKPTHRSFAPSLRARQSA